MIDLERGIDEAGAAIFTEALDLLRRKQRDYGPGNIEAFGTAGVLVRASDKLARLINLLASGQAPANETVEDTWLDLLNYAAIGLMLERGLVFRPRTNYALTPRLEAP